MSMMDKLEEYLKKMGLMYFADPANKRFILKYNIEERIFNVGIEFDENWVRFHTIIVTKDQLGKVNEAKLHKELLIANGALAEVCYFITPNGDVGCIGHEGTVVLDFDGFAQEYHAIPYSIGYFIKEIAPKLKINVPGFS
jgi:hypothetical protein